MKILSISLDNSILDQTSALSRRTLAYGELVEKYAVIVPSQKNQKVELSVKIEAYGSGGGNRFKQLINIYCLSKNLLNQNKFDVITVQDQYYLALVGLRLAKKFKIGLEIQAHGFEKFYGLRKFIASYVLPRADAVRCVSRRLKKQLVAQFGVAEEKITVAPICSELATKNNKSAFKKENNKFIFLTVGRLVPVKNIGLQIAAMREVVKRYPEAQLWIVGDGPEKKNYEFSDQVKLLGQQKDVSSFYERADAFLLTSNFEGWGLSVIEAASFGLPIIMTDVGCAGEVIKNNQSGLIIPIGDKEKLAEAMLELINDRGLVEKLGAAARAAIGSLPTKEQTLILYQTSWRRAAKK